MSDKLNRINKEIENISRLLAQTPSDHTSRPVLLDLLGGYHVMRFELLQDPDDATKAIEHTTSALALTPDDDLAAGSRERRTRKTINYAEPKLNT